MPHRLLPSVRRRSRPCWNGGWPRQAAPTFPGRYGPKRALDAETGVLRVRTLALLKNLLRDAVAARDAS